MQNHRVTAFGEILFDVYHNYKKLGGAPFNFIYHIKKIIGTGNLITKVGNDENGKEIINFLKKNNFSTEYIQIDKEYPTGMVKVELSENKIPEFQIFSPAAWDFIENNESIEKLVNEQTDILYFGTLAQRSEVSKKTLSSFFGREIKYFCDLNLRQNFYSKEIIENALKVADLFKVNLDELNIIMRFLIEKELGIEEAVEVIMNQYDITMMCVTMGEEGAYLANKNEFNRDKQPRQKGELVDTVGAGDAYAAIMCLGYLQNLPVHKINALALEFASEICGIEGALPSSDYFYKKYKRELNGE
ncbi:PfkB family carbohydrate kinase [Melioribacteraceae bacterium 4301-Me]|uniref:PfkB family carbohydrate kinase n=1 Tax=Pyranulibacter aquaticus TaxID=3163344 RepID=UPI003597B157